MRKGDSKGTAHTTGIQNGWTVSIFDIDDNPNATDLAWARTIMHEAFHAYLIFKYHYDNESSYGQLVDKYTREYGTHNTNLTHHELMTETIVYEIGNALFNFAKSSGYNVTRQYCLDLTWGGLQETEAYKKHPRKSDLDSIISKEHLNLNGARGKVPCK